MQSIIKRVEDALAELKAGKMIILADDPSRENEGDLVMAAEKITADAMNFMIRKGTGIVCLSMTAQQLKKLDLPLMVPSDENTSFRGTPFTISIDAKEDITTGVSSLDRAITVQVAVDDNAKASDLVKPGHIFPLQAKDGGIFERQGHTEGSVDLMRLAGMKPAAVICEIMNPDGTMTHGQQLQDFADEYQITMISIDDLMIYRLQKESLIEEEAKSTLPLKEYGEFEMTVVKEKFTHQEHIVLSKKPIHQDKPLLVRIHSSCTTGDLFGSNRCDCHDELHHALKQISEEGGMLIYLKQEGRGIGLLNKIKAYALQDQGLDTVEANVHLDLPVDDRHYYLAANILHKYGIQNIRLLTNNPTKIMELRKYGIQTERQVMPVFLNEHNHRYLKAKKEKLNHEIDFDFAS